MTSATVRKPKISRWSRILIAATILGFAAFYLSEPITLVGIDLYQSHVSPHKGYHCAHAAAYGGKTCSEYGEMVIREFGLVNGTVLLLERFDQCEDAMSKICAGDGMLDASHNDNPCSCCGEGCGLGGREWAIGCCKGCTR